MLRLDALVDSRSFTLRIWMMRKQPRKAVTESKLMEDEFASTFQLRKGHIRPHQESTWENRWIGRDTEAQVEAVGTITETVAIVVLHLRTAADVHVIHVPAPTPHDCALLARRKYRNE